MFYKQQTKIVSQSTPKNIWFFRKLKKCTTSRNFLKIERNFTFFKILSIVSISYVRTKGAQCCWFFFWQHDRSVSVSMSSSRFLSSKNFATQGVGSNTADTFLKISSHGWLYFLLPFLSDDPLSLVRNSLQRYLISETSSSCFFVFTLLVKHSFIFC